MGRNLPYVGDYWGLSFLRFEAESTSILPDFDYATYIVEIDATVREIARSNSPLFSLERSPEGELVARTSALGKRLLWCMKARLEHMDRRFDMYSLCPTYVAFRNWALTSELRISPLCPANVGEFNACVGRLRDELRSPEVVRCIAHHDRKARGNTEGLVSYVRGLNRKKAPLLVVRMELGHQPNSIPDPKSLNPLCGQLVKAISRRRKPLWYAWRLSFSPYKNFFHEVLFVFRSGGDTAEQSIGELIGEIWQKRITKGTGTFVKLPRGLYREVGTIAHNDSEGRAALEKAAFYLARVGCYARLQVAGIQRTYGSTPRRSSGPKPTKPGFSKRLQDYVDRLNSPIFRRAIPASGGESLSDAQCAASASTCVRSCA